jgi:hypothetical protein
MSWRYDKEKITYFADTDFRGQRVRFGIRAEDRARHMYIIGKTGMGKSTLLENLAVQDIQNGEGMCFIDPHGGTADLLLRYVPKERINDVVYFAPADMEFPVAMNVLEKADMSKRPLIASGLLGAFKKVWPDSFSARMEYMLSNTLLALLEMPGSTLLGVNRMLADKGYRDSVIENITDSSVKSFWIDEFGKWTDKMVAEAVPAIQNKVGQFSANPLIRNILGQTESTFDIKWLMDNRKIFIVDLSKGKLGESNSALIGALLITKMYLAAMSRAEMSADELKEAPPFYLYVDEFQSFANESFADILSEARKYKLCLTVAHQYVAQLTDEVRDAVFGNVGTMITFRVGAEDGESLEKEFAPVFTVDDFVSLGFAQVYLKLMIKGAASAPFSARTRDKPPLPEITYEKEVVENSRKQFSKPRLEVEKNLEEWLRLNSTSPNASGNAPQTKKFSPGMRPDRPRFEGGGSGGQGGYQPQGGGQGGYQPQGGNQGGHQPQGGGQSQYQSQGGGGQGQNRYTPSDRPSPNYQGQNPRPIVPGGMGLRDALQKVNIQNRGEDSAPVPQTQPAFGAGPGQPQIPNQPEPQYQNTQPQYGQYQVQSQQPQYMPQYPQGVPSPQYQQMPPYQGQPMYQYGGQPQMPPPQYGYPYVLPPMMPQYGYPQMPQYPVQQYIPGPQYPSAPPYGYQPTHPGYGQYMAPPQNQPTPIPVRPPMKPAYEAKQADREQVRREVISRPAATPVGKVMSVPRIDISKPVEPEIRKDIQREAPKEIEIETPKNIERQIENEVPKITERDNQIIPPRTKPQAQSVFPKRNDNKGPSAENIDSLAAALAKLQKKAQSMPEVVKDDEPKESKPNEVPIDVLKKVLGSDPI